MVNNFIEDTLICFRYYLRLQKNIKMRKSAQMKISKHCCHLDKIRGDFSKSTFHDNADSLHRTVWIDALAMECRFPPKPCLRVKHDSHHLFINYKPKSIMKK